MQLSHAQKRAIISLCLLTISLAGGLVCCAPSACANSWLQLMEQGQTALNQDHFSEALVKFQQALLLVNSKDLSDPRTSSTLRYLGDSYFQNGRLDEAASCYQREIENLTQLSPSFPDLPYDYYQLSLIRFRQSHLEDSLGYIKRAWQIRQCTPSVHTPGNTKIILQLMFMEASLGKCSLNLNYLEHVNLTGRELRDMPGELFRASQYVLPTANGSAVASLPLRKLSAALALKAMEMLRRSKNSITKEYLEYFISGMANMIRIGDVAMIRNFARQCVDFTLSAEDQPPFSAQILVLVCRTLADIEPNHSAALELIKRVRPRLSNRSDATANVAGVQARVAAMVGNEREYKRSFQDCSALLSKMPAGELKEQLCFDLSMAAAQMGESHNCHLHMGVLPSKFDAPRVCILIELANACRKSGAKLQERIALQEALQIAERLNDKTAVPALKSRLSKIPTLH